MAHTLAKIQEAVVKEIQASPLADAADSIFTSPAMAMEAMPAVNGESPLRMWLMGQWLILCEFAKMTGRLEPENITPTQKNAANRCLHKLTSSAARFPHFFEEANQINTVTCELQELETLMKTAPSKDLIFFFHGIYSIRVAIRALTG